MIANFGGLGLSLSAGIIILFVFIVVAFFNTIFSLPFIGFIFSLISYFVYDYRFGSIPVIAALGFIFCLLGFTETNKEMLPKVFAIFGLLISGYILLLNFGII